MTLLDRLLNSPRLPSLPAVAVQALEMTRREDVNMAEIAKLISNDPALSSKILKTVNSSFYGLTKQVSTISHALVILGLQAVKTLTLGFSLLSNLDPASRNGGFDHIHYWKRSLYSAVAAKIIAKRRHLPQQEEAFLAGLLADVGSLVMHQVLGAAYDELYLNAAADQERLIELCQQNFGLDHPQIGAALAEKWQLPPVLVQPIACHHNPEKADEALRPLVEVVYVAMMIGDIFAADQPGKYVLRAQEALGSRLGFTPDETESILRQVAQATAEVARLFEVNIGEYKTYEAVTSAAQEALISLTLEHQQRLQTVEREKEVLNTKAHTDPLTGLANRGRFDEFLSAQFARATKLNRPIALLFLDLDHFKKVNDVHGHQAGDTILAFVGKLLKKQTREIDLAARYGGEEFTVILTETTTDEAARFAESLRQAISAQTFSFDGKSVNVSASIGIAGTDRTNVFVNYATLTGAADRAVYAAKTAGRNCTRIFRPKVPTLAVTPSISLAAVPTPSVVNAMPISQPKPVAV